MISRVLVPASLLVLVLAAGVLSFPQGASAQRYVSTFGFGSGANIDDNGNGGVSESTRIPAILGLKSITVRSRSAGISWDGFEIYTCAKTAIPQPIPAPVNRAKSVSHATSYLSSECDLFEIPFATSGNNVVISFNLSQTMIDNGGFVLVVRGRYSGFNEWIVFAQWVPLYSLMLSPGALSIEEGGSGTYTVKLSAQPTDDVTILVASNNAGVAVKTGSNPAGTRQELTFTRTNWNTAQTVTVEALSDDNSLDERAIVSHGVSSGSAPEYLGIRRSMNVNVMDDDYPGLMITGGAALESEETLDFTVRLNDANSRPVEVDWTLIADGSSAGTATAGTATTGDYDSSVAGGTLVFYEGSPRTQTISFPINDDRLSEGDETVKVSLSVRSPSQVRISGSSVATGTIVDDDEETAVGATMSESPVRVGDTTVTVDYSEELPPDIDVILPSELESDGEAIEELTITLGPPNAEIDEDRFGYTGDAADHVLVDIDVSPVPDAGVRVCLPVTEGLRRAAGERRIYIVRFSGGSWQELSSTREGEMVCADTSGFSPFAVVYEQMNTGSGGCAISGENRFASPATWFSSSALLAMTLGPLLFFGLRFQKRGQRF